ncbi:MAG: ATP-binding protein [Nitrospirota bacterium]
MKEWILKKRRRVILSGLLIVVIPLLSLALFVHFKVTATLEERIIRENKGLATIAAHSIEERLKSDIELGRAYATRPYLLAGVKRGDKKEMDRHLKILIDNSHTIERVFITNPKGVQLSNYPYTPETIGKDFSARDWYKGVSKNWTSYVSEFYMRMAQPQRYLFSIAVPMRLEGGIIGILVLQPKDNYIKNAIGSADIGVRHIYVVDKKGVLIYHNQYAVDRIIDFSNVPVVQKVTKGLGGVERTLSPQDKEPVIAAYQPVAEFGWGVIVEKPESIALAPVKSINYWLIAITGLMLSIGGFFAYKGAELLISSQRLTDELKNREISEKVYTDFLVLLNRQFSSIDELCDASLKKLSEHAYMDAGIFYVLEERKLIPYASFAVQKPETIGGLSYECITQKRILGLKDIPPDTYLKVNTGMGILLPRDIIAIPLIYKGEPVAALELASLKGFEERNIANLERMASQLAIGAQTIKDHLALKSLSEELSRSNEELQAMNEELQSMNEEVHAMNEELQAQQKELMEANFKLAEASKAKSDFLANMSHELRTPLNSILGFSEILTDELYGKLNEKQQEYVKDIHSSGKHLLNLINDILDLSKVESGKMELEPCSFPLRDVLNASIAMLKEKAIKHNIKLGLEIEPEADTVIEADERKLKQIMFNLLSNAVKFTQDGGSVSVQARKVGSQHETDFIEISVIDTGIGIKSEDVPRLFKEFTQLESPYDKRYEGTGLGLALTRRLVELHGGKTWVESEFGKGSKFTFAIPVKQPVKPEIVLTAQDMHEKKKPADRRILVIEDDPKTLDIVEKALAAGGYSIVKTSSGSEGLEAVKRDLPDLIVLDLMMPDMSGFDVADILSMDKKTADIPIIVLTAMDLSFDDKKRIEGKVRHIYGKGGLTREMFMDKVKRVLEK